MAKPAVIKCPKCGYLPNMLGDVCLQCGTRLVKYCGDCGFANSVEKNYCDQCGAMLALQPPAKADQPPPPPPGPAERPKPKFTLEMESIQDTVSERATSFRSKAPPPPKPEQKPAAPAPQAAQAKPKPTRGAVPPEKVTSALSPDSSRLMKEAPLPHAVKPPLFKRIAGPVITLLLAGVLMTIVYMIIAPSLPKLRLTMTAKSYLTAISKGDFEKAYDLLSSNSKANISLEEYVKSSKDYYAKAPAWQFKDLEVFSLTPDAAMIRYQLREAGGNWKPDYISFVREHNRWARPYIWILFDPITDAFKRQDFPQALFLAQKLYLTDPVDPRSSAYLCEAEFLMNLHEKAVESCKRTIDAAAIYPPGYVSDNMFQYNSHYADSLRYLQRDRVALQEYDKLLKWPGLTPDQACQIHMNRADSYVYLKDYDKALQEVMTASTLCAKDPEKGEAKKRLAYLSGTAGDEAVAFAKKSRFQQGMPPLAEARKQQLEMLKARLGPRNAKFLPKDQWMAAHVGGPEYRVFLREESYLPATRKTESRDVFVFLINLWTNKAKVEKAPPPPPPPGAPPQRPGK